MEAASLIAAGLAYLCSLASSLTSLPAWATSLPAPSMVLHAVRNAEAPKRTTRLVKVIARYLRIMKSFCHGVTGRTREEM